MFSYDLNFEQIGSWPSYSISPGDIQTLMAVEFDMSMQNLEMTTFWHTFFLKSIGHLLANV